MKTMLVAIMMTLALSKVHETAEARFETSGQDYSKQELSGPNEREAALAGPGAGWV